MAEHKTRRNPSAKGKSRSNKGGVTRGRARARSVASSKARIPTGRTRKGKRICKRI